MSNEDFGAFVVVGIVLLLCGMFIGYATTNSYGTVDFTAYDSKSFSKVIKTVDLSTAVKPIKDKYTMYLVDGKITDTKPVGKEYTEIKMRIK